MQTRPSDARASLSRVGPKRKRALALPSLLMMRRSLVTGMAGTVKSGALERLQLLMRSSRSRSVSKTRSFGISTFSRPLGSFVCSGYRRDVSQAADEASPVTD